MQAKVSNERADEQRKSKKEFTNLHTVKPENPYINKGE